MIHLLLIVYVENVKNTYHGMNLTLYKNGALRVYSPRKGIDWRFDWRKVDEFVSPFLVVGILIFVLIKVYSQ